MSDVKTIFSVNKVKNKSKYQPHLSILSKRHPKLKKLIEIVGPLDYEIPVWGSINDAILYSIIGQMLSVSASKTIIKRLVNRFGSSNAVFKWAARNKYRKGALLGVSERKRKALAVWERFYRENRHISNYWRELSLEEYRREIKSIWGLGSWSADMVAIFHHGRLNVFPENDLGIQNAVKRIFNSRERRKLKGIINGSETVVSLYLWEYLDKRLDING